VPRSSSAPWARTRRLTQSRADCRGSTSGSKAAPNGRLTSARSSSSPPYTARAAGRPRPSRRPPAPTPARSGRRKTSSWAGHLSAKKTGFGSGTGERAGAGRRSPRQPQPGRDLRESAVAVYMRRSNSSVWHHLAWPVTEAPRIRRISRGGRNQRSRRSVTAVPGQSAWLLILRASGMALFGSGLRRGCGATPRASLRGRLASADNEVCQAWRYVPGTGRALVAGSEMGAAGITGAEWEALEGAGWEFLVEHVAGTTGMTGLRGPDDEDMGTGRPISESDGP
jgi:hypothetical protein